MGANIQKQSRNALYIKVANGELYYSTDENDPNHIMETYEKDGVTKKIYKTILHSGLSGKIVECGFPELKFGKMFVLTLEDEGKLFDLQLRPGTFDLDKFINQLMCVDPSRNVLITAMEDVSKDGKYKNNTIFLRYESDNEMVGFKYTEKNGNKGELPKAGKKINNTGDEVNDWAPYHAFFAGWIKNEFGPLLEKTNGAHLKNDTKQEIYIPENQEEIEDNSTANETLSNDDAIIDADSDDLPF